MGFDVKEHKIAMFNDGSAPWSTTKLGSIGLAVKNAMLIPEKTAKKYMFIDSFTVSQRDVLASFERLTGQTWDVVQVDAEEQKQVGMEKMSKGHFSNYASYEQSANDLLSLPTQTLDEVLAEVLEG
ncbi:MAG: hypothetical protein Q9195_002146 [Heterodermia aff. obscurata]